ncbi:MAG: hypothetical protein HOE90_08765 [Bacteriovoracaceae bacterium]|jgi:hypothetical protein|nr:hypothetical protein [Bacteriovoracaceae bacterium]
MKPFFFALTLLVSFNLRAYDVLHKTKIEYTVKLYPPIKEKNVSPSKVKEWEDLAIQKLKGEAASWSGSGKIMNLTINEDCQKECFHQTFGSVLEGVTCTAEILYLKD